PRTRPPHASFFNHYAPVCPPRLFRRRFLFRDDGERHLATPRPALRFCIRRRRYCECRLGAWKATTDGQSPALSLFSGRGDRSVGGCRLEAAYRLAYLSTDQFVCRLLPR